MKKNIIIISIIIAIIVGGVSIAIYGKYFKQSNDTTVLDESSECKNFCDKIKSICPSLIEQSICEANCPSISQENKDNLSSFDSCEALYQKPELISQMIVSENNRPEQKVPTGNCQMACGNNVSFCLATKPNINQAILNEGYNSCLKDCADWNGEKIECMVKAVNCEMMTNKCGL